MRNISTIGVSAAVICMAIFVAVSGCIGPAHWDGWTGREIVVTVFDGKFNTPISNAMISLQSEDLPANPPKELKVNATTGPDGIGKLFVLFGASGKKHLLTEQGSFRVEGSFLKVTAEGYSTLTDPLSSLVGKERIPIGDKSAILIRVNLTKID
jgi:hypothetical protein